VAAVCYSGRQVTVVVVEWCSWCIDQCRRWHADCIPHSAECQPVRQSAGVSVSTASCCSLRYCNA